MATKKSGMGLGQKIKSALTSPSQLFNAVKGEKGFKTPLTYYAVLALVSSILSALVSAYISNPVLPKVVYSSSLIVLSIVVSWIASFIVAFIFVAIVHVFVYLLGGKGGYLQTYKAYVYGMTPSLMLGWLPFVNIIVALYSGLYLFPKGMSILQNMGFGRALAAVLLPIIIISLIMVALFFAFLSVFLSGAGLPVA